VLACLLAHGKLMCLSLLGKSLRCIKRQTQRQQQHVGVITDHNQPSLGLACLLMLSVLFAGSHDKGTFIASSIAQLLFPQEDSKHTKDKHSSHAGYLIHARSQYRKMLVPLRKCLDVPEVLHPHMRTSVVQ